MAGEVEEPDEAPPIDATLPCNVLVGLKDAYISKIISEGTAIPTSGETDQFSCDANSMAFTLQIPVYEGHLGENEIPYGPFNRHLGTLLVNCPPTDQPTQLVLAFEVDDSRNYRLRCWFKHDPSVMGEATLEAKSASKDMLHIVERTERVLNDGGERIRPDERARINRKKQTIIDLCEQYVGTQADDQRQQIIQTGEDLKNDLRSLEQKLNL